MDVLTVAGAVVGTGVLLMSNFAFKHPETYGRCALWFVLVPAAAAGYCIVWSVGWGAAHAHLGAKISETHNVFYVGVMLFGASVVALVLYALVTSVEITQRRAEQERRNQQASKRADE